MKSAVTLRKRAMQNGGYSLYLDYSLNGVRTREFLKMYLVPERSRVDKALNAETLKQADGLRAKRTLELQQGRGVKTPRKDMTLVDFLDSQIEWYEEQGKQEYVYTLTKIRKWVVKYGKRTTLQTIDKHYVLSLMHFLKESGLSPGSIHLYFSNLNTVFNNAYRDELMDDNPIARIERHERPKKPSATREYLTLDEVKTLIDTRCGNPTVKQAFLFACFTGLRLSDIEALHWEQIKDTGQGFQVEATMIKTKKPIYAPLSANALAMLPHPFRKTGQVFKLPSRYQIGDNIRNWVKRAGITKKITFHCSRHTYATLLITYGVDLYTVSSLLGHTDISTTQIYAKIIDSKKKEAVSKIPEISL